MSTAPQKPEPAPDQDTRPHGQGLIATVVYTVLATSVVGLAVYGLLFWTTHHDRTTGATTISDLVRAAGLVVTGLAAAAGAAVALRRQRSTEETHRLQKQVYEHEVAKEDRRATEAEERSDRDQVERLRDRFTTAAGQLGDDAAAVRLAGVYAMAALADDWIDRDNQTEAQVCIDVLCAYQRAPRHLPATEGDSTESPSIPADVNHAADTTVRETITRVIRDHLTGDDDPRTWQGKDLDFSGTTFIGRHSFAGATFSGGTVTFAGATVSGGSVTFDGATFSGGTVTFAGATVSGGTVTFDSAKFSGGFVDFTFATFSGGFVDFTFATFSEGAVIFRDAAFSGGTVCFGEATFSGGTVTFFGATFSGGTVTFRDAALSGGTVNFRNAAFTGGIVDFMGVGFEGASVPGPWGTRPPPRSWPPNDEANNGG